MKSALELTLISLYEYRLPYLFQSKVFKCLQILFRSPKSNKPLTQNQPPIYVTLIKKPKKTGVGSTNTLKKTITILCILKSKWKERGNGNRTAYAIDVKLCEVCGQCHSHHSSFTFPITRKENAQKVLLSECLLYNKINNLSICICKF